MYGVPRIGRQPRGPPLRDVFRRRAGSVAGFDYSSALKGSAITWDEAALARWLSDPDTTLPNNNMDFRLPKAQERTDVIAYFETLAERKPAVSPTNPRKP